MCALCGVLLTSHWAEDGTGGRARALRGRLLRAILARYGLRLDDQAVYVLRDTKGRAVVVTDIGALWQEAERLAGRPLDPLDPGLVAALTGTDG